MRATPTPLYCTSWKFSAAGKRVALVLFDPCRYEWLRSKYIRRRRANALKRWIIRTAQQKPFNYEVVVDATTLTVCARSPRGRKLFRARPDREKTVRVERVGPERIEVAAINGKSRPEQRVGFEVLLRVTVVARAEGSTVEEAHTFAVQQVRRPWPVPDIDVAGRNSLGDIEVHRTSVITNDTTGYRVVRSITLAVTAFAQSMNLAEDRACRRVRAVVRNPSLQLPFDLGGKHHSGEIRVLGISRIPETVRRHRYPRRKKQFIQPTRWQAWLSERRRGRS